MSGQPKPNAIERERLRDARGRIVADLTHAPDIGQFRLRPLVDDARVIAGLYRDPREARAAARTIGCCD